MIQRDSSSNLLLYVRLALDGLDPLSRSRDRTIHDSSSKISWTSSGDGRGVAWSKFLIVDLSADLIFRARCAEGIVSWVGLSALRKRTNERTRPCKELAGERVGLFNAGRFLIDSLLRYAGCRGSTWFSFFLVVVTKDCYFFELLIALSVYKLDLLVDEFDKYEYLFGKNWFNRFQSVSTFSLFQNYI